MGVMGSWTLNKETDGDVNQSPYGEITFEDTDPGRVLFTIDLDGILDGADIHQFGFESLYDGVLAIDPTSIGAADFKVKPDAKVAGLGNLRWDYVVSFDNGNPVLEPLTFSLYSTADNGFDATDLLNAAPLDVRGDLSQVAVHVQRTSTPAGSETVISVNNNSVIPEPASLAIFGLMLVGLILKRVR
ncbi:MAG: PEP-CTERM sorting domain-containing protein [Chloroflexi bacterium]|nr:PEP-CTERM sorting domain-containing protein [Chloroflexota bacterium]